MPALNEVRLLTDSLRLDVQPETLPARVAAQPVTDWSGLLTHADRHSLTPLLCATWQAAGVLAALPESVRAHLLRAHADNARRNSFIRAEVLELHALWQSAQAHGLVLKGWPLVERLYADPAERVLYDHDWLMAPAEAEAAHRALLEAGFRPLPGKDAWVEKHLPPVWRNDGYRWDGYLFDPLYPRPVEVHTDLWEAGWRGLAVRALPDPWARAQTRIVAGQPMRVLGDEDTLIHLALHFAGHLVEREARLNQLLDLARFLARTELDWDLIVRLAAAANVGRFVYASLDLARAIFAAPSPPAAAQAHLAAATPAPFRAWLTEHGPADVLANDYRRRGRGQDYRLTFLAARSWRERFGIVRFAALPPLGQLQAKYRVRHRWQAALLYPVHIAERALAYSRALTARRP